MSDTIGIMRDGRIEQFAAPRELYDAPANRYVADFVGESNFFAGGQSGVIAVRPEAITLGPADGLDYRFAGRVQNRIYLGDQTEFSIQTAELGDILVRAANSSAPVAGGLAPGDETMLGWRRASGLALVDG